MERASRRRVRVTLVAAIAVIAAGLVALGGVVLGTLAPQLSELSLIGDGHARVLTAAMHLREHLASLVEQLSAALGRSSSSRVDVDAELRVLDASAQRLEALCSEEEERTSLKALRDGLRGVATLAGRAEREREAGRLSSARAAVQGLSAQSEVATRALGELVRFNAEEMRDTAAAVHTSLRRAMVASTALALLVLAGTLVLLRHALRAIEAHDVLVERHAADLAAFASRAAHELRTPLHTIGLALHVLRNHPAQTAALDRAEASARRLAQTIDEILRFSRSGGAPDPGVSCEVSAAVDAVAAELGPRAAEAGLELVTDAPPGLDAAMAEGHLRTVLQNLVGNALKYGRSEGGQVAVRAVGQGGRVVLTVSDTGPGIPPEALARVFEPFYRASGQAEGYGLGLPTVKRLVDAHGGVVRVASEPGGGTTVTVELPRPPARQRGSATALPS